MWIKDMSIDIGVDLLKFLPLKPPEIFRLSVDDVTNCPKTDCRTIFNTMCKTYCDFDDYTPRN